MPTSATPTTDGAERISVDFHFDVICGWTWVTSRWLLNAQQVRPIDITWHVMSLGVMNEGKEIPEQFAEIARLGWGTGRALVAAEAVGGQQGIKALYDELGRRMHVDGQMPTPEVIAESVAAVGLPASVAEAAADPAWDAEVRASHDRAMALVGEDVGSPVVQFGEVGVFGPVVSPAPRGEDAGRLFDAVRLAAEMPEFFELKRTRTVGIITD